MKQNSKMFSACWPYIHKRTYKNDDMLAALFYI